MQKVLVDDENENQRKVLRRMLEHEGFQVIEACDGGMATEACNAGKPHLLTTDFLCQRKRD